ncbi:WEB family protein At1g75720 [Malania oleifera]|uniref:WEB family protein At1g75720 n=1 Tax=Malania oleifera TaxID=397392 RepID=UPI0025ADA590|nr:WEB family protein At1g75720 [Malania oleifera]
MEIADHSTPTTDYHSKVDTSRPFNSVKEAVAVFGERVLAGEIYSLPRPYSTVATPNNQYLEAWKFSPSPPVLHAKPKDDVIVDIDIDDGGQYSLRNTLRKLEAELEETKREVKLLKERESETEVALASLNAELHKNMSKLAKAEAAAAAAAAATARSPGESSRNVNNNNNGDISLSEDERRRELYVRMEESPTLAQILSINSGEDQDDGSYLLFEGSKKEKERKMLKKKKKKKKPIIPLVGDLFSRKKAGPAGLSSSSASTTLQNRNFYSTPRSYFG